MTNETIGHYASHPGGGTVGWNKDKGFHGDIRLKASQLNKSQPSDLELRIRKEVVASVEELVIEVTNHYATDRAQVLVKVIQDRLNLLWNEQ